MPLDIQERKTLIAEANALQQEVEGLIEVAQIYLADGAPRTCAHRLNIAVEKARRLGALRDRILLGLS